MTRQCGNCRHWSRVETDRAGLCGKILYGSVVLDSDHAKDAVLSDPSGLFTSETFGCSLWEDQAVQKT